ISKDQLSRERERTSDPRDVDHLRQRRLPFIGESTTRSSYTPISREHMSREHEQRRQSLESPHRAAVQAEQSYQAKDVPSFDDDTFQPSPKLPFLGESTTRSSYVPFSLEGQRN